MDGNSYSCRIMQNNHNLNVLEEGLAEDFKYKPGIGGILMKGVFCFKNINQCKSLFVTHIY